MEQEIDIFGVYISPFAVVLGLGLLIFLPVRACLDRLQFDKYVWHRSLCDACIYVIVVGVLVLIFMNSIQIPDLKSEEMKRYLRAGVIALLAIIFGWIIWYHYQLAPWTRDGRVRVQVANVASEVSGKIVEIKVRDNQRVKKGDPLFVIFQNDYRFALDQAQAQVDATQADMDIQKLDASRREKLGSSIVSEEDIQTFSSTAVRARAMYSAAVAARDLAKLNLDRTVIYSPVNGYVTNFQMRIGDYAHPGDIKLSIVDEDSFWVSAYFEETQLPRVHEGNIARIKLMGVGPELDARVDAISRGIADTNTAGGSQSLPDVDPVFTWVRLAQRIPVHIEITHVPDGVVIAAGRNLHGHSRVLPLRFGFGTI